MHAGLARQDEAGPVRLDALARRSEPQSRPGMFARSRPGECFVTPIRTAAQAAPPRAAAAGCEPAVR